MRIDGIENVGIGKSSGTGLHVAKSISGGNDLTIENTNVVGLSVQTLIIVLDNYRVHLVSGTGSVANSLCANRNYYTLYFNDFVVTRDGVNANMFVEGSNGNLGFNTTTPNS